MDAPQLVWFKRDLRVTDHAPLAAAAAAGPVLPLFVVEPDYWRLPDAAGRHWAFQRESLIELRAALAALGQPLVVRTGPILEILEELRRQLAPGAMWSHQETGNGWTFARDRAVARWARAHGIPWHELPQSGVIRGLRDRAGWARRWDRFMRRAPVPTPTPLRGVAAVEPGPIPLWPPGLGEDPIAQRQPGGRRAGQALLASFLAERGLPYRRAMAGPQGGAAHCSRLSPHLAHGTLALREVLQAAEARMAALHGRPEPEARAWRGSLGAFIGRLHWHCHFIQKLEDEPAIETGNLHPAYDGLRCADPARLAAWAEGRTGWPFVDACMRALSATGWLNFRMRAMLMAVASYQLWLPWRDSGLHLARLFTDYEPGIHWPQAQMQSGTTGINTVRIYNPVKQGLDQDPDAAFIARWLPELRRLPVAYRHEPWRAPPAVAADAGLRLGRDYPAPLVDHLAAARRARELVWGVRRDAGFNDQADAIQARHGSRRSGLAQPRRPRRLAPAGGRQLDLGV
jgi:deoxyribodipyrimidine photo-lyase